jgi:hypothetical protein
MDIDFPSSIKDRLRLTVFRDLWRKGFHLTSGLKFGCDYLVYPGASLPLPETLQAGRGKCTRVTWRSRGTVGSGSRPRSSVPGRDSRRR